MQTVPTVMNITLQLTSMQKTTSKNKIMFSKNLLTVFAKAKLQKIKGSLNVSNVKRSSISDVCIYQQMQWKDWVVRNSVPNVRSKT
jgi:hypothetical protein